MNTKIIIVVSTVFFTLNAFSQQIENGFAPSITDFSVQMGSGAYNAYNPIGTIPDLSYQGGWQHLMVVRHPNPNNNFQLQIASSMSENDKLYFRKLASPSATSANSNWNELATRGSNSFTGSQSIAGNVVIRTSDPRSALEVFEVSESKPGGQTASSKSVLKLSRMGTPNYSYIENAEFRIGHGGGGLYGSKLDLYINGSANTSSVPDQHVMTWNFDGNVGIGTTNPTNKLDVNGTIHSKEVKVDMNGWSDFVFKKEYNLPTLDEVEKHIAEKGHLENIPSEKEVLENGINLGEMNAKLLQKIEELTLYAIEQEQENKKQSLKIELLERENEAFKAVFERLNKIEEKLK
ncbi:hypothetical protein [Flavobacterium sp. C3NV]|uniref:hypothetical protein n=1 Tax=Flavobacterium sp. C3NV TaxID=3393358 RepID=UPI00398FE0EF